MSVHLHKEIENLKKSILTLGGAVEERVRKAVSSVLNRKSELAKQVIESDNEIDRMEIGIEEDCLKTLALHQPVAGDLRMIVAILKINNDLERIGDMAVNIAERSLSLISSSQKCGPFSIPEMAQKSEAMLSKSLDALVRVDVKLAREVRLADDEVDDLLRDTYSSTRECITDNIKNLHAATYFIDISRNLERIADLATNIAEDVIYMVEGQIVRHPEINPDLEESDK